ncbi:hypothetical protein OKJ48_09160 [Streptomyces kunmingensis]|uniref:Terminase n=1 Tax=Streptomyces kunmingensis TaxID=68225 RepID=A0ABU6C6V9_9ACTN|nr:hypothetical protein [Streptomyces kunmingensis]MEB3960414.1 hypothetical protein [Streptomyces kunmingensis]
MTDRIPLDEMTSDQLGALYARAEQAEAERDGAYRERAHLVALLAAMTSGAVITPPRTPTSPDAATTLAEDVRILRTQIQAKGGTPAARDSARAVEDLPDRVRVPVVVPGPRQDRGASGKPAPTITP